MNKEFVVHQKPWPGVGSHRWRPLAQVGLLGVWGVLVGGCAAPPKTSSRALSPAPAAPAAAPAAASAGGATELVAAPPDFELLSLDGDSVRLGDHLGRDVVLIDFWATFCTPCLTSMPHLEALFRKYRDEGFVVLGISIDGPDSVAQVRTDVARLGISFPILLDQETRVVGLYNPRTSAPYSVLIGRDGRVLSQKEGYSTGDAGTLEAEVRAALEQ